MTEEAKQPTTDERADELDGLKQFLRENGQAILIGIVVLIVTIGAITWYKTSRQTKESRAAQALLQARSSDDLQRIVDLYGSTATAPIALLSIARMQFENGQTDLAQFSFDQFLFRYPDHPMTATAILGKAQCLEAGGDPAKALAAFDEFIRAYPDSYLLAFAIMGRARTLEQMGRFDEALATYEDHVSMNPDSPWMSQLETALLYLKMAERANRKGIAPSAPEPRPVVMDMPMPMPVRVETPAPRPIVEDAPVSIAVEESPIVVEPAPVDEDSVTENP